MKKTHSTNILSTVAGLLNQQEKGHSFYLTKLTTSDLWRGHSSNHLSSNAVQLGIPGVYALKGWKTKLRRPQNQIAAMEKTQKTSNVYSCQELLFWMSLTALSNPDCQISRLDLKVESTMGFTWKLKDSHPLLRISAEALTAFGSIISFKWFFVNCPTCFKGGLVICQSEDYLVISRQRMW